MSAACNRTSYGVAPSPPSFANSMSSSISLTPRRSARSASRMIRTPVFGSMRTTIWLGWAPARGCVAEHEAHLGLTGWQLLSGADEERHAGPAPVVDLQAQRDEGLGIRAR